MKKNYIKPCVTVVMMATENRILALSQSGDIGMPDTDTSPEKWGSFNGSVYSYDDAYWGN